MAKGVKSVVLSKNQLSQIEKFFNVELGGEPKKDDPWQVWNLSEGTNRAGKIKGILKGHGVKFDDDGVKCELGYYHHRIIFRLYFCFDRDQELTIIRSARDAIHKEVRRLLNEILLNKKIESDR
jgi:hypothetical protein